MTGLSAYLALSLKVTRKLPGFFESKSLRWPRKQRFCLLRKRM